MLSAPRRVCMGWGVSLYMERFRIKPYGFGELAQMYYPDHRYDSALHHFREEMHLTRGMWAAMVAEGYKENTKILTRAQVRTIVQFLGEP